MPHFGKKMAIPAYIFGGIAINSMLVAPVFYDAYQREQRKQKYIKDQDIIRRLKK